MINALNKNFASIQKPMQKINNEIDPKAIYLDYMASTPMDPRVLEAMLPYFIEIFGNPHSRNHKFGWDAETGIENARNMVAELINADPSEIIFTSGATESNNLAIKGAVEFYGSIDNDKKNHIITVKTEHKCVLESCRYLKSKGYDVTYISVHNSGIIDLEELENAITDKTIIVSVMAVNNETGVIQPLETIGEICRKKGVIFHTDAAQGYGKIPIDVRKMHIDMLSISGHKIYGPKGIGALFVGKKPNRIRLSPIISGGGQERNMRSGTLPTPSIVGLGEAAKIAAKEMCQDIIHLKELNSIFIKGVSVLPKIIFNGDQSMKYPGCINVSFAGVEGESLIIALNGIAVSSGSACTSASLEPSYVLMHMGIDKDLAHTSLRFSFGRFTTKEEIDKAVYVLISAVKRLRSMSPIWEMMEAGIDLKSIKWASEH